MSLLRAIAGEFRKTVTLPAALVALGIATFGSVGVALVIAFHDARPDLAAHTSPSGVAFDALPLGTVGALILGIVVVSSEYTANSPDAGGGRQISTTLVAVPHRLTILVAKALVVTVLTPVSAAVAVSASLALAHLVLGNAAGARDLNGTIARSAGVALYWTLMALIAFAVTVFTRSGIIPLIWFIANSSVISLSLLLTKLTPLARYLPDLAGMRLFADTSSIAIPHPLDPVAGGLTMTAWALGLLFVSAIVFTRRDA